MIMKNTKDQNIFALLLPACKIDTYQWYQVNDPCTNVYNFFCNNH